MTENESYKIYRDETMRETIAHGTEDYPLGYYYEDVYMFDFHCVDWHWHSELELVYVEEGEFDAQIGSSQIKVRKGQALLINEQVIHRFDATGHCIIPNIVFLPSIMAAKDSLIYDKYISPILSSSLEYILFTDECEWMKKALNTIIEIFCLQKSYDRDEYCTVLQIMKLWKSIYDNYKEDTKEMESKTDALSKAQLQIMIQYIQSNYTEHISLAQIADIVSISKSSALNIFNRYLHTTPVNYLIQYRINKAARLLRETDTTIASVAYSTGFDNTGYFCRKFKQLLNMTPGEYRKQ